MIHETAIVHPDAKLHDSVSVGAYSIIGPQVTIGAETVVGPHVVVRGPTTIGAKNQIFQFSSVGEDCQDKKYAGEPTTLVIGDNNVIREGVTIHRGTVQDIGTTIIGSNNLFMVGAHVAHDCVIGDNGIFANNCTIAGHVHIGDWAILGGMSAVHQFCHIGDHCFAGGGAIILRDIPPFTMLGKDGKPHGINSEGLKRRGLSSATIMQIKRAHKALYRGGHTLEEAKVIITDMSQETPELTLILDFLEKSNRGIVR